MTILNVCSGCNKTINDLYYLIVGSKFYWHLSCLNCRSCGISLQAHSKCYLINGAFYCCDDYFKLKEHKSSHNECLLINNNNKNESECSTSNCKKCKTQIKANDYVIRLNDNRSNEFLFHMNCFVCFKCNTHISPGHQYGLIGGNVYCSTHYFIEKIDYIHHNQEGIHSEEQSSNNLQIQIISSRENVTSNIEQLNKPNDRIEDEQLVTLLNNNLQYNNSNQSVDLEINNSKRSGNKSISSGNVIVSGSSHNNNNNNSHGKKKRIRTSFKHQQLRIMKAHFQINQNPDSKDLKELSERTGLQKRVLQVWFQNSRAKQRKSCSSSTSGNFNQIITNSMIIDDKQQSNDSSLIMEEDEHDQEGDDDIDNEDSNCVSEDLNDENDNNNNITFQTEQEMKKYHQLHHLPPSHHNHHHHQINKFNQETEFQQQFQPLVNYYRSY